MAVCGRLWPYAVVGRCRELALLLNELVDVLRDDIDDDSVDGCLDAELVAVVEEASGPFR